MQRGSGKVHSLPSYTPKCSCHILSWEGEDQWLLAFSKGESMSDPWNELFLCAFGFSTLSSSLFEFILLL